MKTKFLIWKRANCSTLPILLLRAAGTIKAFTINLNH